MSKSESLFERWHPYWNWECYKSGMWKNRRNDMDNVMEWARVLSSPGECKLAMRLALALYPISADQHLTKSTGRRPWIGQAACCAALGATEEETRIAWNGHMTQEAQDRANAIADAVIAEWEAAHA